VMLGDIKRMYPFMFDRIMLVLEELEGIEVPEEEVAYITLHFQASLERLQQPITDVKRVVIVCHMGMGMSQLLRTKIERNFTSVLVLASIGKGELQSFLETSEADLIISTISLPDMGVPAIVVSPLLGKQDEERLKERLTYLEDPVQRGQKESVILKFANPFLVFLQQEGSSRYELIRKLAGTLVDKGFVDHAYIENAMIRERMSATTIGAGIAIPHGHPDLIHQSAIAIATLREPIEWGEEKVSIVFLLAVKSTDPAESRQLFQEISLLTENPERIEQLLSDRDAMTFLTHLGAV
jgi:activator of the mannose operon, transcriptional antiterminator